MRTISLVRIHDISNPCSNSTNYLRLVSEQYLSLYPLDLSRSLSCIVINIWFSSRNWFQYHWLPRKKVEAFSSWRSWRSPFSFVLIDATFMKYRLYLTCLVKEVYVKERPLVCFGLLLVLVFPRLCYVSLKKELSSYTPPESCCSKNRK